MGYTIIEYFPSASLCDGQLIGKAPKNRNKSHTGDWDYVGKIRHSHCRRVGFFSVVSDYSTLLTNHCCNAMQCNADTMCGMQRSSLQESRSYSVCRLG